jgi:hypothetical protein
MSNTIQKLWCFSEGGNRPFSVTPSLTTSVHDLKRMIKEEKSNALQGIDAVDLTLWKVRYF